MDCSKAIKLSTSNSHWQLGFVLYNCFRGDYCKNISRSQHVNWCFHPGQFQSSVLVYWDVWLVLVLDVSNKLRSSRMQKFKLACSRSLYYILNGSLQLLLLYLLEVHLVCLKIRFWLSLLARGHQQIACKKLRQACYSIIQEYQKHKPQKYNIKPQQCRLQDSLQSNLLKTYLHRKICNW